MNNKTIQEGKTLAILCYVTFIGCIIAYILNIDKRNNYTFFHIRQSMGILIFVFVANFFYVNWINDIFILLYSLSVIFGIITSIQGKNKPIPFIGEYFQKWFKNIK